MVRRFLRYSLDHNKPVRVLFADTMKYKNITVVLLEGDRVSYLTAGRKRPLTTETDNILSASYARGDDGDTLRHMMRALEQGNQQREEEN